MAVGRSFRRRGRTAAAVGGLGALVAQLLFLVVLPAGEALAAPGSLDPGFGNGGAVVASGDSGATGVALEPGTAGAQAFAVTKGGPLASAFVVDLFNSAGGAIWSQAPFGSQSGSAKAVAVNPANGNIVAVGYTMQNCPGAQAVLPAVVEFTTSNVQVGNWVGSCSTAGTTLNAVVIDGSGNVVAAGTQLNGNTQSVVDWFSSTIGAAPTATATSALQTSANSLVLSGADAVVGGDSDGVGSLAAFKTTGLDSSAFTSGIRSLVGTVTVNGLAVAQSGDLVAVSLTSGTSSVATEITPSGTQVWQQPLSGWATSVAYQPLGGLVYVGGTTSNSNSGAAFVDQLNSLTGSLISAFGSAGSMHIGFAGPSSIAALAPQLDGKVVAVGGAPLAVAGNTSFDLARVYGPTLSVQSPPIDDVTSYGPVGVQFTISIDEPLFNSVAASLCAPGASINSGPSCNTVTIPAGPPAGSPAAVAVNVSLNFPGPPGTRVEQALAAEPGGGLAPSLTNPSAVAQVWHLEYFMVASDGGIFTFHSWFWGSKGGSHLNAPIVGAAADPDTSGYWMVASDGGIFAFHAPYFGSKGGQHLNAPVVGMARDPQTGGYWMVASDGGIFAFNAPFFGSHGGKPLNKPIVGMAATPDGGGYWLVASDGGIFAYGDAGFYGSKGGTFLSKPIVGMAADNSTGGYWLVASDGGIFAYHAPYFGSKGGSPLNAPIVGMAPTPAGNGYWLVARDGGIFSFPTSPQNAPFFGSMGGHPLNAPIVGMAA